MRAAAALPALFSSMKEMVELMTRSTMIPTKSCQSGGLPPPLASAIAMMAAISMTHERGFHMKPKNLRSLLSCATQGTGRISLHCTFGFNPKETHASEREPGRLPASPRACWGRRLGDAVSPRRRTAPRGCISAARTPPLWGCSPANTNVRTNSQTAIHVSSNGVCPPAMSGEAAGTCQRRAERTVGGRGTMYGTTANDCD
jgi:hypothetical protein